MSLIAMCNGALLGDRLFHSSLPSSFPPPPQDASAQLKFMDQYFGEWFQSVSVRCVCVCAVITPRALHSKPRLQTSVFDERRGLGHE